MAFELSRVTAVIVKDAIPVAGVAAVHIGARAMDAAFGLNTPWKRLSDWTHVGILAVAAYFVGEGKHSQAAETWAIADSALLASSLGDYIYALAQGTSGRNPGSRAIREAEAARELAAGRGSAVLDLSSVKSRSGSFIEF